MSKPGETRNHAASGDCEEVRYSWLGQPVNTVTSGAYLLGSLWLVRDPAPRRLAWAAVLAAVAFGSIGYHGPGSQAGKRLHDSSLVALTAMVVSSARRPNRHRLPAASVGGVAVMVHAATRTGCRGCRPASRWQGHGLWHVLSAGALTMYALGEAGR